MLKRVLLLFVAAFTVSCSAKIEPYYVEYELEMRNDCGVDVKLYMQNRSVLPEGLVLKNGESVKWRTNSGVYAWPFDNVDFVPNIVYYNDIYLVEYGTGQKMVSARNPGDVSNYVKEKIDESTYSMVYTFTKNDYDNAMKTP